MSNARILVGLFVILMGVSVFVDLPVFKIAFALLLVYVGVKIIFGQKMPKSLGKAGRSSEDYVNRVLVFSAINRKFESQDFEGAEIVAIFSGGEVDLSEVKTKKKELELNLVAIMGGLKIRVPANWSIRSEGVGILGGFDHDSRNQSKNPVKVTVKGVAILGGVEIS